MATHTPNTPPVDVNAPARPIAVRREAGAPVGSATDRRTRRRFLTEAGAALITGLGVTAAVLSPDPVWGTTGGDGPDAALIAACTAFDALQAEERAMWRTAHTVEEEDRLEPQVAALHDRQAPLVATICSLRATTDAGHIARARTFALLYGAAPGVANLEDASWDKRMAAAMGRDLGGEARA